MLALSTLNDEVEAQRRKWTLRGMHIMISIQDVALSIFTPLPGVLGAVKCIPHLDFLRIRLLDPHAAVHLNNPSRKEVVINHELDRL